jgi:hypothetical protein
MSNDLVLFTQSGLISAEAQEKLAVATIAVSTMKTAGALPTGERHFSRADSLLSVRNPSPASQARDVLQALDNVWSGASTEFHRYRKMFFDVKLKTAKLSLKRKKPPLDPDEMTVFEAECEADQAEIDALQTALAEGQAKIKGTLDKAADLSGKYALLGHFSADDFMREEVVYLIKTAWWHVGQTFQKISRVIEREKHISFRVGHDVGVYFEALGIFPAEVKKELEDIARQKEAFDQGYAMHPNPPSFMPYFESWLNQVSERYTSRVMDTVKKHGPEKLKRIQSVIKPTDADGGTTSGTVEKRGSFFEA